MKKVFGIILILLALAGMINFARNFSKPEPSQPYGNTAYNQGRKAGKFTALLVMFIVAGIGIRLLVQGSTNSESRSFAEPGGPENIPLPGDPSLRGAQNTFASNPVRLRLKRAHWLEANPGVLLATLVVALAGAVVVFISWIAGLGLIIGAAFYISRRLRLARQKFFMGDTCPGVVLSVPGNLVAVYTDLIAGGGRDPRPAIRILKQPLSRMTTEPATEGMRVAAAALYHGNVRQQAWDNFSPEVINCVIHDPQEIHRVLTSIPEREWQMLDSCLARLSERRPGTYRLWAGAANLSPSAQSPSAVPPKFSPPTPWYRSGLAIGSYSIVGAVLCLVVVFGLLQAFVKERSRARSQPFVPPRVSSGEARNFAPNSSTPVQAGPFTVGANVSAHWGGKWIDGKITTVNAGGFSVMVQLDDPRFKRPMLLSTNLLKLR